MKTIKASPFDLESFNNGKKTNKIADLIEEITSSIPKDIKIEVKYRKIRLTYFNQDLILSRFSIPYCFDTKEFTPELKEYFDNYVIIVTW